MTEISEKYPHADNNLFFSDETAPWKIIIADDEPEVHSITKTVLRDYCFEGRKIEFISTYSGEESRECVRKHPDTAIILLDAVMEKKDSGPELVPYIREVLGNRFMRIILRTGHPAEAPENEIIARFDINDCKEKSEQSHRKLAGTVTTALRAYRDLRDIEKNRRGLAQIIESSARLFEIRSLKEFAKEALTQMRSLLGTDGPADGFTALKTGENSEFRIPAATGRFEHCIGCAITDAPVEEARQYIDRAVREEKSFFRDNFFIGYFPASKGRKKMICLSGYRNLTESKREQLRIFSGNLAIAFDNISFYDEIAKTRNEVVLTLGEVVETRSKETFNHVRRVAEFSYLLALKAGLDANEAKLIRSASPLHDIGKVGIPDSILLKKGELTAVEFEQVKTHVNIGYEILKNSHREIMQAAAIIAQQHHERWDGLGYFRGLKGEDIHIYGRITTLADIFDALSNARIYKEAWEKGRIISFVRNTREKIFDPMLTDIFLKDADEFFEINRKYSEKQAEGISRQTT